MTKLKYASLGVLLALGIAAGVTCIVNSQEVIAQTIPYQPTLGEIFTPPYKTP